MTDTKPEEWETVTVTALPLGWLYVYRSDQDAFHTEPCPAILLQKFNSTETWLDRPSGSRDIPHQWMEQHRRGTRVVYANRNLEPVIPTGRTGYQMTTTEQGFADWLQNQIKFAELKARLRLQESAS